MNELNNSQKIKKLHDKRLQGVRKTESMMKPIVKIRIGKSLKEFDIKHLVRFILVMNS